MKFIYIGENKAGQVTFTLPDRNIVMPHGVAVEVDDARLAGKLANNQEFVAADDDETEFHVEPEKRKPGRPRKG